MSERDPRLFCDDILDSGNASWSLLKGFPLTIFVTTEGHILLLLVPYSQVFCLKKQENCHETEVESTL